MKIALFGFGKMGKAIEEIALKRNHTIQLIVDSKNAIDFNSHWLKDCDVAIEFSNPESVIKNVNICIEANIPLVVGTTGWLVDLEIIEKKVIEKGSSFVYASNFSLGANIFFQVNKNLGQLINQYVNNSQYNVCIEEVHHLQKLDAPSGTAFTLANDLLNNLLNKKEIKNDGVSEKSILNNPTIFDENIVINSLRKENVPGTHVVKYFSDEDEIAISHIAYNRTGFAFGAILAAEKIISTKGFFEFRELMF